MRISQETILAVEGAVQIEEVLNDFLSLEKKGKKYLCPFHQEQHPSFSITSDGKFYKCFSCSAKGSATSYLMEHQGMSYQDAMRYLAEKYQIPWQLSKQDEADMAREREREALYILHNQVNNYYISNLGTESSPSEAYAYLKERDLHDPALLSTFGIGYSLPQWHALYEFATIQGYEKDLLEQAGLVLTKEDKTGTSRTYDRFRGRLMFPIHNFMGKIDGFAGRHLGVSESNTPKYLNSPETLIYQKSYALYGIYQGKQAIKSQDMCYLVEGYTDVLSLHQASIKNVVATSGTALTQPQIKLIQRFTRNVTLLFDGDSAGEQAALRGIDLEL